MSLFGRQNFGREDTKKELKKMPPPPRKEEKKDTSIFGGKMEIERSKFEPWLRDDPKLLERTGLRRERRVELGKKIFGAAGSILKRGELERIKTELELGSQGKFRDLQKKDRDDGLRIIRESLRK